MADQTVNVRQLLRRSLGGRLFAEARMALGTAAIDLDALRVCQFPDPVDIRVYAKIIDAP
jgi:hypothetical protein